jgi:hypothetical protein
MRGGLPIGLGRGRRGYFECAFTSAQSRPRFALSIFSFGQKQDQRPAVGVRFLWPPSGFLFGQLKTDATLQACAYFGRIMALPRFERFFLRSTRDRRNAPGVRLLRPNRGPSPLRAVFSSVNSRPTQRSRRARTSAESWPFPASSGFFFGQLETGATLLACVYFGRIAALPRFERFFLRLRR